MLIVRYQPDPLEIYYSNNNNKLLSIDCVLIVINQKSKNKTTLIIIGDNQLILKVTLNINQVSGVVDCDNTVNWLLSLIPNDYTLNFSDYLLIVVDCHITLLLFTVIWLGKVQKKT